MANESVAVKEFMEKESLSQEEVQNLCRLVYGSEKSRNAVNALLQKMDADPSFKRNAGKAYKLAIAYWFADRDDDAIMLLGKHLKSKQAYVTYLEWCMTKELYQEAHDKSVEGLKANPKDIDIALLGGQAAAILGKLKEAQSALKAVEKKLNPLDIEKLREDKAAALKVKKPASQKTEGEESEEKEIEAAERFPQHGAMYFLKGLIEEAQGNWEEAIDSFGDAITVDEENILAYFRKAYQLDLRGLDQQALETYEAARRLRPLRSNIVFNLGVLYEDMGKNKKAIQCYKTILEYNPNHFRAKLFLEDAEASRNMVYDEEEEKEQDKLLQVLNTPITDFELSVRSRNCLAKMNIRTLGDLSRKSETELLSYKNFGETSLAEIKALLTIKGLSLGMTTEDFFRSMEDEEESIEEAPPEEGGLEHMESTDEEPDLLDTPLVDVPFSIRCGRAFDKLGLRTLRELVNTSEEEFHSLRNFGETSMEELKSKLAEYGMSLATS